MKEDTRHRSASRVLWAVAPFAADVAIGVLVAAMILATLLFSSGVSKFVYIDF